MKMDTANPFWTALSTVHAPLAIGGAHARRYGADVLPVAALHEPTPEAVQALFDLLEPGEEIYVTGDLPSVDPLRCAAVLPCLQMEFPMQDLPSPTGADEGIRRLEAEDAPAMVGLTDLAFPGFFRPRTYLVGSYFGIESPEGTLIAMAGERAVLPGHREISAVCTHPEHTGKGLASLLIRHLLQEHARAGIQSFLHVAAANTRAVAIYRRLGFVLKREINFNRLQRTDEHEAAPGK